jgi:uncharacterized protein YaaW (UPF0174 family)
MSYRHDPDLNFLGSLNSDDLNDLVFCLTCDKDGNLRLTEELTMSEEYKHYYPDHHQYWKLIAAEIQCFGANSFMTMFRGGEGVIYKEVLSDVCDRLKVNYNKESSSAKIENNLLLKILSDSLDNMSQDELKDLAESIGLKNTSNITPELLVMSFQATFRHGGFKSYQLALIIVNAVIKAIFGRGLSLVANATLVKTMSILTGPIGWVISGLWTAIDIAGPAYRVTIPAVVIVAGLRQKHLYSNKVEEISFT